MTFGSLIVKIVDIREGISGEECFSDNQISIVRQFV